jgi:uncharacterized protein (AIM24 family)
VNDRVIGTTMPVLEVTLDPGESLLSESGEFSWMTDTIEIGVTSGSGGAPAPNGGGGGGGGAKAGLGGLASALGGKGGLTKAIKRVAGGGTFLFNTYTAQGGPGVVTFAAKLPGHIFPIDVGPGEGYLAHRHGFMAGTPGIEVSVQLQQSFTGGIFGGEGFLLQHLSGQGRAWISLSGEVLTFDLAPGQTMRVHPGHIGLFQSSVQFSVVRVPGLTNRYLGADGHHFVVLTGPGKIWLQSMPLPLLAGALEPYLDRDGRPVESGAVGGVLGGLLGDR